MKRYTLRNTAGASMNRVYGVKSFMEAAQMAEAEFCGGGFVLYEEEDGYYEDHRYLILPGGDAPATCVAPELYEYETEAVDRLTRKEEEN